MNCKPDGILLRYHGYEGYFYWKKTKLIGLKQNVHPQIISDKANGVFILNNTVGSEHRKKNGFSRICRAGENPDLFSQGIGVIFVNFKFIIGKFDFEEIDDIICPIN